jgi:hypothetical protein
MDGWVGGWVAGKAGLRIAYSNQKYHPQSLKLDISTLVLNYKDHYKNKTKNT